MYCDTNIWQLICALRPRGTSAQSTHGAFKNHGPLHQDLHLVKSKAGEGTRSKRRAPTRGGGQDSLSISFSSPASYFTFFRPVPPHKGRGAIDTNRKSKKKNSERVGISALLIRVTRACNDRVIIMRMITACGGLSLHMNGAYPRLTCRSERKGAIDESYVRLPFLFVLETDNYDVIDE